jgi:hypothetical protein
MKLFIAIHLLILPIAIFSQIINCSFPLIEGTVVKFGTFEGLKMGYFIS